jgi:hypothetical protein
MGRLTALVLVASLLPSMAAAAATPLLQNGRFTDAPNGMPASWRIDAWNRDYSEFGWEPAGSAGGAARIVSHTPNVARRMPVNVALANGFGFGGQNACAIFRKIV